MATVRDIVTGALRRLAVLDVGEEPEAEVAAIGLAAYNAMHAEAVAAGWFAGPWADQGMNDAPTLGAAYAESAKAAVAVRIAPDFGVDVGRRLALDGAGWLARLAAAGTKASRFENGLRHVEIGGDYFGAPI
jgi:hypothetical protein